MTNPLGLARSSPPRSSGQIIGFGSRPLMVLEVGGQAARTFGGNSPERLAQLSDRGRWTRTSTTDLHVPALRASPDRASSPPDTWQKGAHHRDRRGLQPGHFEPFGRRSGHSDADERYLDGPGLAAPGRRVILRASNPLEKPQRRVHAPDRVSWQLGGAAVRITDEAAPNQTRQCDPVRTGAMKRPPEAPTPTRWKASHRSSVIFSAICQPLAPDQPVKTRMASPPRSDSAVWNKINEGQKAADRWGGHSNRHSHFIGGGRTSVPYFQRNNARIDLNTIQNRCSRRRILSLSIRKK